MAGVPLDMQGKGPTIRLDPPAHYATGDALQVSYYNESSAEPLGEFVKRPSGDVDLASGHLTGENFPDNGLWKQV